MHAAYQDYKHSVMRGKAFHERRKPDRISCDFPIKIMGKRSDAFAQSMVEIVLRHAPDFAAKVWKCALQRRQLPFRHLHHPPSRASNWTTCTGS